MQSYIQIKPNRLDLSRCSYRSPVISRAATSVSSYQPLPRSVTEMINASASAISMANSKRHLVQFILPVNEKARNFNSTEAQDYPESTFSEFNTATTVCKQLLSSLGGVPSCDLQTKRIDEGGIDGDLCCVMNTQGLEFVAVVWPTAGRLKQLKTLAENTRIGTLIIVNPQWKFEGELLSEFGFGPWRVANEAFISSFNPSYSLNEQRIGSPSSVNLARGSRYENGGVVRIQRSYSSGGDYEVHLMSPDGSSQALGSFDTSGGKPSFQALEKLIVAGREAKLEIFDVARAASRLELERGGPGESEITNEADSSLSDQFHSRNEILQMEISKLRRVLASLQLPTSGSLSKLQARALAVADKFEAGEGLEAGLAAAKLLR